MARKNIYPWCTATTWWRGINYHSGEEDSIQSWVCNQFKLQRMGGGSFYFSYLRLKKWVHNCAPYDLGSTIPVKRSWDYNITHFRLKFRNKSFWINAKISVPKMCKIVVSWSLKERKAWFSARTTCLTKHEHYYNVFLCSTIECLIHMYLQLWHIIFLKKLLW